jgi:hypothetical protein
MAKVGWLEHQKCPDYPVHCSSQERSLCLETKVDGQKGCFTHNIYYLSDKARHALQITTNFHGSPSFLYSLSKRSSSSFTAMSCVSWNFRASASVRTPRISRTASRMPGKVARSICCCPGVHTRACGHGSARDCGTVGSATADE